ncbi:Eco57I restriction-modification methylase domain-containing protein [Caldiplasma sukawensis]
MIDEAILREKVYEQVIKIESSKDVYDLFKILGYPETIVLGKSSKRKKTGFDFRKEDEEKIKEIFSILSFDKNLSVFLLETKTLHPSFVRSVTNTFDKQYLQYLLIFTVDYSEISFVFPDKEKLEVGKYKLKLTKLNIDKKDLENKNNYYSVIQTLANMAYEENASWKDIWKKWKKSFSVERVTKEFFIRYKEIFFKLRENLNRQQKIPSKESHEFTLQFLNRIMFIYFISKKRWLEKPNFIEWLWSSYKELGKFDTNEFYEKWLKQIFLKAFNNRANEIINLPDEVIRVISNVPYLNGGLFRENDLDNLKVQISDRLFKSIFEFFESYNFTIKEDMPLESEVAVDPQMIGYVYESLANLADEIYDAKDLGIFYTPRVEVDFMCRRSLVEYFSKTLTEIPKEKFYHLFFDPIDERERIENWFTKENLWRQLEDTLNEISVVDPACGSGAFLVGMLNVLSEIYKMIYEHLGGSLTDFALKNRIIQYSLYGVDAMPWAIHAAELRLWLQLIVETEFKKEDLKQHPLLPNLNLNLRVGDSIVQEIGGINFNLRNNNLKDCLKKKLDDLKQEKRKYFENSPNAKFKTSEEVRHEEIILFEGIINERIETLEADIKHCENTIKDLNNRVTLYGEQLTDEKNVRINEEKIQLNRKEIDKLESLKLHLKEPEKKPFVWDIDFAEIFAEKNGFDIVVGNPPYVRQEMISPPNRIKKEVSKKEKEEYKEKLIKSIKERFPVARELGKRSDYYIYFYFHGLSLLNSRGTFCFITSNSWLDVEYGRTLQEFLCKYVPITAIYDNPKRSFAHADVNTIIALFGAPEAKQRGLGDWIDGVTGGNESVWPYIKNTAKFVMFKKPFEEILSAQNLIDIENVKAKIKGGEITELVKNVVSNDDYRVFPIVQEDLLEDGWEYPDDYKNGRFKVGSYEGNKWGGKYLRAPDIFYTVLNKGNFVPLSRLGKLRRGYIPQPFGLYLLQKNEIEISNLERNNLLPVFSSPKEFKKITLSESNRYLLVFDRLSEIENSKIYEWFKKRKKDLKVKDRSNFGLGQREQSQIVIVRTPSDRHIVFLNQGLSVVDHVEFLTNVDPKPICATLNSTLYILFREIYGRANLGLGTLKFEVMDAKKLPFIDVELDHEKLKDVLSNISKREIFSVFEETGMEHDKPIREQEPKPLPDRAELDKIIFDELGLTLEERKEVYWSVCELVKQRLDKAKSVKKKK